MAEIRFPKTGRDTSRGEHAADVADPLVQMKAEIEALDDAAATAAAGIATAAEGLGAGGETAARADLLAGLAAALVDRTAAIREDCERLSAMMDRTARLVFEGGATAAVGGSPVAAAESQDADDDEPHEAGDDSREADDEEQRGAPAADDELTAPTALEREPSGHDEADRVGEPVGSTEAVESAPAPTPRRTSDGVRLIATQMAIAGSSRPEIERRLRIQFGVEDADQALDDIFGSHRSEVS